MAERTTPTLTLTQARTLHLAAQGLAARPKRTVRQDDLLAAIARMQLLQIDTIHVVARSPYLVLFSRVGGYPASWLDGLLERRAIFETWAHEACFAPAADYKLHRSAIEHRAHHWAIRGARRRREAHGPQIDRLIEHVRERGAVKAADFERPAGNAGGGWWQWKDEKTWLETAFALGELMVARRENFHRVYDLPSRVIGAVQPDWENASIPDDASRREILLKSVRALGVTQARWVADYFRLRPRVRDADLAPLVEEGALLRVEVKGWDVPGYVHRDFAPQLALAAAGRLRASHATLLSPFDPVVWDRERASELFGFDYTLECYTPEPKRRYGYFVLPILVGSRLVGRLDAKAHRREGVFEVKALYVEEGIDADDALAVHVARAIDDCARWHGTPRVTLGRVRPASFARLVRTQLAVLRP
ncbi:winged helix-turn-helix domain-containing protein [Lysobacter panacisoli]|uniref:Winged helix-turn-helix domain-containing protein n=1 Tax=Lysobacter panacisoli TaxID=1255263 RepID=A0ABP9LPX4_9GAMM|nr:crosslink repair DNA glycosylase YcaQ family protein [Lysobacter panacisoli]